jgi:excisionase family DNA binding protein
MPVASVQTHPLLDVVQAAEFLGISRNGLYIQVRAGKVPHYRVGGLIRFDLDELREWLEGNRGGPEVGAR